jgi:pyrimidine deaminase RibD-like protein
MVDPSWQDEIKRGSMDADNKELEFMNLAVNVARQSVSEGGEPRPKVGAVLCAQAQLLGTAFRGEVPKQHAEYILLETKLPDAAAAGATLYTTLEPCTKRNHPKRPCAEWILDRRISRVVIGMLDPNQLICGKGIQRLREGRVQVDLFPPNLMAEVEEMNRDFILHQRMKSGAEEQRVEEMVRRLENATRFPVINPRYSEDLARLDGTFNISASVNRETVFIVVGESVVNELLDRIAAGLLRDTIDAMGSGMPFRRGIIVTDHAWLENASLRAYVQESPAISLGSVIANRVTQTFITKAQEGGGTTFYLNSGFGLYIAGPPRRAALWGNTATGTVDAVRRYIERPEGLRAFWRSTTDLGLFGRPYDQRTRFLCLISGVHPTSRLLWGLAGARLIVFLLAHLGSGYGGADP